MRVQSAQPIPRTPILVVASIVVLVAAALVPVPGVFPAAAAGILICAVALTKSVWDAAIATVVGSALILIAAGTGANILLAVVFMATVSLGAAAAMRIGRGTIALVVAAVLSIVVAASAGTAVSLSALSTSGVALASGLLLCSVSAFVVRLSPGPAPRAPRSAVVAYVALLVPIAAVATWANTTVFAVTRGWALAAFFVALAVGILGQRTMARLLAVVAGAFLAAVIVTVSGGIPVFIVLLAVVVAASFALAGRVNSLAAALTTALLLMSASIIASPAAPGPEPLLAAVGGAFLAWGVLSWVTPLGTRRPDSAARSRAIA